MSHFRVLQPLPQPFGHGHWSPLSHGHRGSPAVGTPENSLVTMAGEGGPCWARGPRGGREDPKQGSPEGGLQSRGSVPSQGAAPPGMQGASPRSALHILLSCRCGKTGRSCKIIFDFCLLLHENKKLKQSKKPKRSARHSRPYSYYRQRSWDLGRGHALCRGMSSLPTAPHPPWAHYVSCCAYCICGNGSE